MANIPAPDKPFWDSESLSSEIPSGENSKYTVSVCQKDGKKFVSLTRWYRTQKSPDWRPKNGVVLPYDKAGDIAKALKEAAE